MKTKDIICLCLVLLLIYIVLKPGPLIEPHPGSSPSAKAEHRVATLAKKRAEAARPQTSGAPSREGSTQML